LNNRHPAEQRRRDAEAQRLRDERRFLKRARDQGSEALDLSQDQVLIELPIQNEPEE
jgi:hypothetical protein